MLRRQNHGNGHKTALGEDNVRFILFQNFQSFAVPFQYAEGICEIFQVKVPAKFTGRNAAVGNTGIFNQLLLNTLIGTDVLNVVSPLSQRRDQRKIRSDVPGCTTAGQNDFLHMVTSTADSVLSLLIYYPEDVKSQPFQKREVKEH